MVHFGNHVQDISAGHGDLVFKIYYMPQYCFKKFNQHTNGQTRTSLNSLCVVGFITAL